MQFAIIGLGVFGKTCAYELQRLGNQVLAIDIDQKPVDDISSVVSRAVIVDSTDKDALLELDLANFDGILVSIGDDLEASLLTTLNLISLEVKNLWVKAKTDAHHHILQSLGVKNIIHPEQDMGIKIAQKMNYPMVKQYMALGDDHFLISVEIPAVWQGRPWREIQQKHPNIRPFMLKRDYEMMASVPDDFCFWQGDRLVVGGLLSDLRHFAEALRIAII